jgi:hypothetical protein|nr:MAG TPA: cysteine-rich protein [Caudoviricetes sp.]DAK36862.1 MAG TPA: cysteine-rich protein [Caudoviricetes sp.]
MNNGVSYTIISRPSYITFECPFCHEEVEVSFEEVDFNTDYWGGMVLGVTVLNVAKKWNLMIMSMIRRITL